MRGLGLGRLCRAALLLLHAQAALADITVEVNSKGIIWHTRLVLARISGRDTKIPCCLDSLTKAGTAIADPMMQFYEKNQTEGIPGKLTDTWYIAGSMFMTLIQYWHASKDDSYNKVVSHDLMFQSGENYDYFSSNYSQWLVSIAPVVAIVGWFGRSSR